LAENLAFALGSGSITVAFAERYLWPDNCIWSGGDWRVKGKKAIIANKINLLSFERVYGSKIIDKIGSWRKTRYREKDRKSPSAGLDDPDADCLQSP
jgi:hypothetical protein